MGADVRDTPVEPRERPSCSRLCSSARFQLAAPRASRRSIHGRGYERRARPRGYAFHYGRYSCWSTRREVHRTIGPQEWRNSCRRARTWFFKCITWRAANPPATKPASASSSPSVPPQKRVLTLQLTNDRFIIPPGVDDYRVEVHGSLPNDALLLSFFPHMHLRGKRFEYNILHRGRQHRTAAARPLQFLLATKLSPRGAAPVASRYGASGRRLVRQLEEIIRTIPIRTLPSAGVIKPTMK